jgi:hypothetical protein
MNGLSLVVRGPVDRSECFRPAAVLVKLPLVSRSANRAVTFHRTSSLGATWPKVAEGA